MKQQKVFSHSRQRSFYDGFNFYPVRGIKKYGNFICKIYSPVHADKLRILDHVYESQSEKARIATIKENINRISISFTGRLVKETQRSIEILQRLLAGRKCRNRSYLEQLVELVRKLQNILFDYKGQIQPALANGLQQFFSNEGVKNLDSVCSKDILDIINIMKLYYVDIQNAEIAIYCFLEDRDFNEQEMMATEQGYNNLTILIEHLENFTQLQKDIIQQLTGWAKSRELFEKMQMWN